MRVNIVQKASVRVEAKHFKCGACGKEIHAGDTYKWAKGRYTGKKIRCGEHNFRRSDLTGAIWGEAQRGIEELEDAIAEAGGDATNHENIASAFEALKETAEDVRSQYEAAAEPFQGAGENADRAEEMQSWIDELEGVDEFELELSEDCQECEGTGSVECDQCIQGKKIDPETNDASDEDCEQCGGSGEVTCEQCGGDGTLENEEPSEENQEQFDNWVQSIEDAMSSFPF